MAHQDYVSRSRSANKKNNPYKQKTAEVPSGMPLKVKLLTLITIIAIIGFSYFLWTIKDATPSATDTQIKTSERSAAAQKSANELPKPPKEKWAYMEQLKTKEVEEGQYEVTDKGPWQMQCGSFRTRNQAEVLKANIAFTGIASTIREVNGKNGLWYKVILGPYDKKRSAERDKHKLKSNNVNYCQIWLWR